MFNGLIVVLTFFGSCIEICHGDQWLMQGDTIPAATALADGLHVENTNSTTSVASSMRLRLVAPAEHRINCVIAASLHLNGEVRVIAGGVGESGVTLGYETRRGEPDLFYVMVESHARSSGELAFGNSRVTILYDRMKDWLEEVD